MKASQTVAAFGLALSIATVLSCHRGAVRHELYWPGQMWEGMNRMVFALQDLGYEIERADTEKGVIVARRRRADKGAEQRGNQAYCELTIQFPPGPEMPITVTVRQTDPAGGPLNDERLGKIVGEIADKFAGYGGRATQDRR